MNHNMNHYITYYEMNHIMYLLYKKRIISISPPDLHNKKVSYLKNNETFNWAYVNLWRGFNP